MKVKTSCPTCSSSLSVESDLVGKHARCPKCRTKFVIEDFHASTSARSLEEADMALETIADNSATDGEKRVGSGSSTGKTLGRFEIQGVLGQGGFGRVYKAHDPQLDRTLALKVPTFGPQDVRKAKRFQKEAKAAAQLRHPNIVPTFDSGKAGNQYFIATQFIEGEPLSRATELGPVDPWLAAEWCAKIADALAYAHEMGIVHRDVKPQNVMLDERSEPQLMDFGLAKRLNEDSSMTADGSLLGTPSYMAPEQARGDTAAIGPHSDQYAVGAILYELLSGKRAFEGSPHVVLANIASEEPPVPRSINPEIPRDLEAIVQKAMSKEIERRYASCEELASDLRAWLRGDPTLARPITSRERLTRWAKRNRGLAAAFGATAFALLLAAGLGVTAAAIQTKARLDVTAAQEKTAEALTTAETERDSAQKERDTAQQERDRADKERQRVEEQTKLVEEQRKLAEERLEDAQANNYVTTFRLADARWRDGDGAKAVALLEQLRPKEGEKDRRGWEWNYLWNQSHSYLAHIGPAEHAALGIQGRGTMQLPPAPDDNSLLYVSDHEIVVVDLAGATAKVRIKDDDTKTQFHFGSFSPDGRWIFTGNSRDELTCWDAATGTQRYSSKSPRTGRFLTVDFSADGKTMLTYAQAQNADGSLSPGHQVEVWNPDNGKSLNSYDLPANGWVQLSPDGRYLVAGRGLWDSRTGAHLRDFVLKQLFFVSNYTADTYCFSPDGRSLALNSTLGLTVFDVESGKEQLVVAAAKPGRIGARAAKIAYSADGTRIAMYSDDAIKVLSATSGELQLNIRGGSNAAAVTFSPDGRSILSAGQNDGTVSRWDAVTGANEVQLELAWPQSAGSTWLSPSDKEFRVISRSQGPMICDLASGETLIRCEPDLDEAETTFFLALSPDGRHAYGAEQAAKEQRVGADSQTFVAWDIATGKRAYTVPAPGLWLGHPHFTHLSADGRYLTTTGMKPYSNSNRFWAPSNAVICNLADGKLEQENVGGAFAINATGDRVLNMSGVWDIPANRHFLPLPPGRELTNDYMMTAGAFSQDGSLIATANYSGTVRIYDVPSEPLLPASDVLGKQRIYLGNVISGKLPRVLREKVSSVTKVAFSPDGRRLMTVTDAGTAQLWDLATNQELLTLTSGSTDVAMSPDGSRIFCLSTDSPQGTPTSKFQCVAWDGRPESEWKTRATERAARSTLAYFRSKTKSQDEIIAAIKQDPTINEDIRVMATRFASIAPPKIVRLQK